MRTGCTGVKCLSKSIKGFLQSLLVHSLPVPSLSLTKFLCLHERHVLNVGFFQHLQTVSWCNAPIFVQYPLPQSAKYRVTFLAFIFYFLRLEMCALLYRPKGMGCFTPKVSLQAQKVFQFRLVLSLRM